MMMTTHTHHTAPTRFIEAKGIRFAYRRFGNRQTSCLPLLFNQHFAGNLDSWDPAVTDGLAQTREVILFDNAGVGLSSGEVPHTFAEMATNALAFVDALGLTEIDLLGFSIGSFVAQNIVLQQPALVRKLILIGSSPRNGDGMPFTPESQPIFSTQYKNPDDFWLDGFFRPSSPVSLAAGRAFLKRRDARTEDRDLPASDKVAPAQVAAIQEWSQAQGERFAYLKAIQQPTLIVNGTHDIIYYTANSLPLVQNIPHAELIIYPDAAHAAPYQYPERFVEDATRFLEV